MFAKLDNQIKQIQDDCTVLDRCVLHHYTGMPRCPGDLSPVRVYIYTNIPPKNYSFLHNYKIHARYHQTMTIHSQSFNLFECNCKVFTYPILFVIMSYDQNYCNPNSQDELASNLFCVLLCKVHITHCKTWFR